MKQLYLIFALLLATLVAIFAVQNAQMIIVRFLVWTFESSLVVVILISAGVGALLAAFVSLPQTLKVRRQLKETEERLEHLARKFGEAKSWEESDEEEKGGAR